MSQKHPPLQHQIAPQRFSSSAASPSLPQVSCSVIHLQSLTCPRSPLTTRPSSFQLHTQCTHNNHQSLGSPATEPETPANHPWQTVKKRKRTSPNGDNYARTPVPIQLSKSIRRTLTSLRR
jgi:hypothetical protein